MRKDFYLLLELTSGASHEQIKSAYHQRALELHPDHYGADSQPCLELQEAYSVLADPARRQTYDELMRQTRSRAARHAEAMQPPRRGEPIRPTAAPNILGDISLARSFETFQPSFDELFDRIWSNFSPLDRPKAERAESLTVDVPLTLDEALRGGQVRLLVPAQFGCPTCRGRGGIGQFECLRCHGRGVILSERPVIVSFPSGVTSS